MPSNIEIKARLRDRDTLRARARHLSDRPMEILLQEDVFFRVPHGRLKLRIFAPDHGELIQYQRADSAGPKQSTYTISPTSDVAGLRAALTEALGVLAVVRKRRELYQIGQTRLHLDQVEGLGDFVELEVVLSAEKSAAQGHEVARQWMRELAIAETDLVAGAYVDLIMA